MPGGKSAVPACLSVFHLRRLQHPFQDLRVKPTEIKPDRRSNQTDNRYTHPFGAQSMNCRTPATITTMASDSGRKTFHPRRINWS